MNTNEQLTTRLLTTGIEVTAKLSYGEPSAIMYGNRMMAARAVARLGDGLCVYRGTGRPFYVARASQFSEHAKPAE